MVKVLEVFIYVECGLVGEYIVDYYYMKNYLYVFEVWLYGKMYQMGGYWVGIYL